MIWVNKTYAFMEYSPEEVQIWFDSQPKCRYKWVVVKMNDIPKDDCFSVLSIQLRDKNTYFSLQQPWFSNKECDGGSNLVTQYLKNNIPKNGDFIYWIANKENWNIIHIWKESYDTHGELSLCQWLNYFQDKIKWNNYTDIMIFWCGILIIFLVLYFTFKKLTSKKAT